MTTVHSCWRGWGERCITEGGGGKSGEGREGGRKGREGGGEEEERREEETDPIVDRITREQTV